jgi:hypothetical protein
VTQPIIVNVTSGMEESVALVAAVIEFFLPANGDKTAVAAARQQQPPIETTKLLQQQKQQASFLDEWFPKTSICDGVIKMIAWHLDCSSPY